MKERGLIGPLWPDQDEDQLVDNFLVEGAGQEAYQPSTKSFGESLLFPMGDMHLGGQSPDRILGSIPRG